MWVLLNRCMTCIGPVLTDDAPSVGGATLQRGPRNEPQEFSPRPCMCVCLLGVSILRYSPPQYVRYHLQGRYWTQREHALLLLRRRLSILTINQKHRVSLGDMKEFPRSGRTFMDLVIRTRKVGAGPGGTTSGAQRVCVKTGPAITTGQVHGLQSPGPTGSNEPSPSTISKAALEGIDDICEPEPAAYFMIILFLFLISLLQLSLSLFVPERTSTRDLFYLMSNKKVLDRLCTGYQSRADVVLI